MLVLLFAALSALLVILLLGRLAGGVVQLEHLVTPGQHQARVPQQSRDDA